MLFFLSGCIVQSFDTGEQTIAEPESIPEPDAITLIDPTILPSGDQPCREPLLVRVNHVVDGDTMYAQFPEGEEKIRFIGIDTPELGYDGTEDECYAQESLAFLRELIDNQRVWLTFDQLCTDVYGRYLAYVHIDAGSQGFVQRLQLQRGMGKDFPFDDTPTFNNQFLEDAAQAQAAQVGGWGACNWN